LFTDDEALFHRGLRPFHRSGERVLECVPIIVHLCLRDEASIESLDDTKLVHPCANEDELHFTVTPLLVPVEIGLRVTVGFTLGPGKRDYPPSVDLNVGLCASLTQVERVAFAASDPQMSFRSDDGVRKRAEPLTEPFWMERSVALVDERLDTELLGRVEVVVIVAGKLRLHRV